MSNEKLPEARNEIYYFDVFKGRLESSGKLVKVRSVGVASHVQGQETYKVNLKMLLKDEFFLLPEKEIPNVQYGILTRSPSLKPGKKFLWHTVGTGTLLSSENSGYLKLEWDFLKSDDIYMDLHPKNVRFFVPHLVDAANN